MLAPRFNGGPGCSSLSGLLLENGPFTYQPGTFAPTQNPYTWVNLTNMLWVEQPVGVGYTQGTSDIVDEVGLAKEFMGFYKQWATDFQAQGKKVYITGESYGGYYSPYVADAFINADDDEFFNLAGMAINDPIIGDGDLQQEGKCTWSQQQFYADSISAYRSLLRLLEERLRPQRKLYHRDSRASKFLWLHRLLQQVSHIPSTWTFPYSNK